MGQKVRVHIPNAITSCNLISGCVAVVYALNAIYSMALLFIIIGALFDFFDGMSARLLKVSSPIGKELDSLADDVTFGVAPASMLFSILLTNPLPHFVAPISQWIPYLAYLMAAFSALRLANFNLDMRQATSFIGLPTPANALFWGGIIVGCQGIISSNPWFPLGLLILSFVSCALLVSGIPMFALKFKSYGWKGNEVKYLFIISCIPILLIFRTVGISIVIAWYVVLSVIMSFRKP